ncbi:MAG: hypothetical protein JRE64_05590 [Deltaproteobacteria bacterium]|nr:hypothetical protein [Deltaproteobacteria bacterium]
MALLLQNLREFVLWFTGNMVGIWMLQMEGLYVHLGLGSDVIDGQWHTFIRDLRSDLGEAQPAITILKVNGFLIRNSGRVDVMTYPLVEGGCIDKFGSPCNFLNHLHCFVWTTILELWHRIFIDQ